MSDGLSGDMARPGPTDGGAVDGVRAACPICERACGCIAVKEGDRLFECRDCRLRFFRPSGQAPEQLYGEHYFVGAQSEYLNYVAEEPAHRRQARRYLKRMESDRPANGAVLDVGCAAGFFLDEARAHGWEVTGLEVSAYASDYARTTLGLPVTTGAFPSALADDKTYDVVTFFNVLEHIAEPRTAVDRLAAIVRHGGLVVIETWDWQSTIARTLGMGWHQYNARHVPCYYTRHAIGQLFPSVRWELVRYSAATKWISMRRATEIIARQQGMHWVTRVLAGSAGDMIGRLDVPYRLGDLVWIVLRRKGPGR